VSVAVAEWLAALDRDPAALEAALGSTARPRLGLYAEKLMAFYFAAQGQLHAHGLQVRADRTDTIGEFDFLLNDGDGLRTRIRHQVLPARRRCGQDFNGLIGPNLADTLGAKMRKIFEQQLSLAAIRPRKLLACRDAAQALVKGWLFYPPRPARCRHHPAHCHGFWMTRSAGATGRRALCAAAAPAMAGAVRLPLAAPAGRRALAELLLALDAAGARRAGDGGGTGSAGEWLVEERRGFVVPDVARWRARRRRAPV
jgi:hypothetical protein